MLFSFQKYVNPTWYFNLASHLAKHCYFLDWDALTEVEKQFLQWDDSYSCREVSKLDIAWQVWQKGYIQNDPTKMLDIQSICSSVSDNYRFLRKYFHPLWSYYILAVRILSLKNPLRELTGFFRSLQIRRQQLYKRVYPHDPAYRSFESSLMKAAPRVSVIIPTLNRYDFLSNALNDLEQQDYSNFEVIIVDQSEPFRKAFYESFKLDIKLIRQEEKALWLARNTAIRSALSQLIALTEDDVRLPKDWLSQHLRCLDFFKADISSGVFFPKGSSIPPSKCFFRWADQFATGNVCLKKEVFEKVGLFDRQFEKQRMGDGEFGLRALLGNFKSISNPYSYCIDLKAPTGGLRLMGSWDAYRPKSWLAPRPVPSVLYLIRKYFGDRAAILALLIRVPPSILPYRFKNKRNLILLGSLLIIPILPLALFQAGRSWAKASRMLREGALIEKL